MNICSASRDKVKCFWALLVWLLNACYCCLCSFLHVIVFRVNPFLLELGYFVTLSVIGFLALKIFKLRTTPFRPDNLDIFFTAVSAVTVSSMGTVEMETFSNIQLVLMTIMMFVGGEVFTSMVGLHLTGVRMKNQDKMNLISPSVPVHFDRSGSHYFDVNSVAETNTTDPHGLELVDMKPEPDHHKPETETEEMSVEEARKMKLKCIKSLSCLVSWYLLAAHAAGFICILIYVSTIKSAKRLLIEKGINRQTFSIFSVVSTFSNCGFIPTDESLVLLRKNSGLLLILIPQILMGNTLFPVCLRLFIAFLQRVSKRVEYGYMLKNTQQVGYGHLLTAVHSLYLAITALGFIAVQMALFCVMEWSSDATSGMSGYQKLVGSLFQVVNSRHTGESVFDLSIISRAVLVLFVLMMYLPPYTSYVPITGFSDEKDTTPPPPPREQANAEKRTVFSNWDNLLFSQLTYITIFVMLVCITERQKIKEDPLNFNILSIVVEVVSAYGNVGFTMGYSCARQINPDGHCRDAWFGFVGKWSNAGKCVLILVMFFGRLKKYTKKGGKAWSLQ